MKVVDIFFLIDDSYIECFDNVEEETVFDTKKDENWAQKFNKVMNEKVKRINTFEKDKITIII